MLSVSRTIQCSIARLLTKMQLAWIITLGPDLTTLLSAMFSTTESYSRHAVWSRVANNVLGSDCRIKPLDTVSMC